MVTMKLLLHNINICVIIFRIMSEILQFCHELQIKFSFFQKKNLSSL